MGNKYHAERVEAHGYTFHSRFEKSVYDLFFWRQKAGEIKDLLTQAHVYLTPAKICYIADFKYFDIARNQEIWAEAKGMETAEWRLKKRLWKFFGPGVLEIYKGTAKSFKLYETIYKESSVTNDEQELIDLRRILKDKNERIQELEDAVYELKESVKRRGKLMDGTSEDDPVPLDKFFSGDF